VALAAMVVMLFLPMPSRERFLVGGEELGCILLVDALPLIVRIAPEDTIICEEMLHLWFTAIITTPELG